MDEKCAICGATENIQKHHTNYEPEIIQLLRVDCHKAVHGHGVGKAPGWTPLFEWLKADAEVLFKEGATNDEVANACDISYATASHWRGKLGFIGATKLQGGKVTHNGKVRRNLSIYLNEERYRFLLEKGEKASAVAKELLEEKIDEGKAEK